MYRYLSRYLAMDFKNLQQLLDNRIYLIIISCKVKKKKEKKSPIQNLKKKHCLYSSLRLKCLSLI